jgi:hypothetical protein
MPTEGRDAGWHVGCSVARWMFSGCSCAPRASMRPGVIDRARQEVTLNRRWESFIGGAGLNGSDALGGLSLSEHHAYDPNAAVL